MTDHTSPIETIHSVRDLVSETDAALRKQHDLLKLRGMSLPAGTFAAVSAVSKSLEQIEAQLVEDITALSQLRAMVRTSAQMNSSLDLDEVLAEAMDNVIDLTGAERGYIVLKGPFSDELEFRIARDAEQEDRQGRVTFQGSTVILNEVLETGQPLLTDNAYNDPRLQGSQTVARFVMRSVLCVPLKLKERVIGVVYVDNRMRMSIFSQRELALLTAFANQVAIAIENARLYERVQSSIAAISEMKELLDNVLASIGSGVVTTDADLHITSFNPAAAQILAWNAEATSGQPLLAYLPKVSVEFEDHLRDVQQNNQTTLIEAEVDDETGDRRALSMKFSPLKDTRNHTQGVAMVVDDLTEQKVYEQTLDVGRRYLPPEMVDNIETIATLALGGERREVTCMFVDARPLSTFPPGLAPREIMAMLNQHLTIATNCVHNYKGVIDKYMGHEVMSLFNSQLNPQTHHAGLAVEAALAIRAAFVALYAELGINPDPHFYRIGIHTGIATLGNVGSLTRRDFTAIGDTINLSKRLEENAGFGQIIISEDALQHFRAMGGGTLPDNIRFEPRDPLQVKGRQQLTPIYEVFRD